MDIRFHVDPETGLPHFLKHGVSEEEVVEVLNAPSEDRPGPDGARVAMGGAALAVTSVLCMFLTGQDGVCLW